MPPARQFSKLTLRTVWSQEENMSGRSNSCINPFLHVIMTHKKVVPSL